MKFEFKTKIYKVGINPCVSVPSRITKKMKASKGYIRIKGKIKTHAFRQTLVPVRNADYRLYVNGLMLKGSGSKVGDVVQFLIEPDPTKKIRDLSMPKEFKIALVANNLFIDFKKLVPSRQKAMLQYLNYLKTKDALSRNIDKIIVQLQNKTK